MPKSAQGRLSSTQEQPLIACNYPLTIRLRKSNIDMLFQGKPSVIETEQVTAAQELPIAGKLC
ncbi:MAG: hypothetical protein FWC56_04615 [Phycisphaerae bacterium]|nr:hypothetical protein [Phycisphaerae bacterium]